ncbi:histidinol-phosphatase [Malassezia yamatoensis]|uniref:Histidinol-phosphatase n=1 Tax=Malassezia yamatoensis TaxID=253288 RepID=A0AAJ5Z0V8_9BASI|nr:histidinol-phosphatase [Malassezia yamatoensis]
MLPRAPKIQRDMHSHHSHSGEFCEHARCSLDQVVAQARQLQFTHFHLSEHIPRELDHQLYPEEKEAQLTPAKLHDRFVNYLQKARRLQQEYAELTPPMHILVGCETENISSPQSVDFLCRILGPDHAMDTQIPAPYIGKGSVDYLVGSVHHAHGIPIDFDYATFQDALRSGVEDPRGGRVSLLENYLDMQLEVFQRLRPEVIGHFDLYRLFEPSESWLENEKIYAKVHRNIRYAASYGALFEANSAAFRKGWHMETYPGKGILPIILSVGGRIALSDDSHGVDQVGLNYKHLRDYLMRNDVSVVWRLERDPDTAPSPTIAQMQQSFQRLELQRDERATTRRPGDQAPLTFPRGTQAVPTPDWAYAPFWSTSR